MFLNMRREGIVEVESITLTMMFKACGSFHRCKEVVQMHKFVLCLGFELDASGVLSWDTATCPFSSSPNGFGDGLILTSFKSVQEHSSQKTKISGPNLVSFNSMITGFAQNGFAEKALDLFNNMQDREKSPNNISFLAVLSACNHVGLVEGRNYFNSMKSLYNIEPGPDHYACMVDLLDRAGQLDEAISLIHSLPCDAHAGVWGARLDITKLAAEELFNMFSVALQEKGRMK